MTGIALLSDDDDSERLHGRAVEAPTETPAEQAAGSRTGRRTVRRA